MSMVKAEFAVLMRVRACNMLLRPAKRIKFHASNMRTKEMLDQMFDTVPTSCSNIIQHVEWSSNTVAKRYNVGSPNMLGRPTFIV